MSCETAEKGLVGQRLPLHDARAKVTGRLKYVADQKLPRMLHAKMLFSPVAHARIKSIDISAAQALPGVRAVICHLNAPDAPYNCCGENINDVKDERLFDTTVRYVGDRVAAVAADTLQIAEKALRLITVEYEELPLYVTPQEAVAADAFPIHPGGNIAEEVCITQGDDVERALAAAEMVFEDTYHLPAVHHAAIETHAALADYDAAGKLTVWSPSQDAFALRLNLSRLFGLKLNRVRVVASAIGGGFGGKIDMFIEPVAALLAMKAGRPVRLVFTRREDIAFSHTRHEMVVSIKTGINKNGVMVAQDVHALINAGAYAGGTSSVAWAMGSKLFRLMNTPHLRFRATEAYTNCSCGCAMRGFGSPQLFFAQQRQLNRIAQTLNIPLPELLLRNLKGERGMDLRLGVPLGNTYPQACVRQGMELFGWEQAVAEQEASRRAQGRYRTGVGMAVAAHGNGIFGVQPDTTGILLHMNEDGTVMLTSGCCDMGNGSVSLQAQFAAEILGLTPDDITCIQADTDAALWDLGNYSSRGTYVSGAAAVKAAQALKALLLEEAGQLLEEDPAHIELIDGSARNRKQPQRVATFAELVLHARRHNGRDLAVAETFASAALAMSFGAHFVKVQVDTETGAVDVLDYVASHDVGTPLNPLQLEGQIEGAIQMGLGYALTEGLQRDERGRVKNTSLRSNPMYTATDMPPIRITFTGHPEETGPYGGKSIGECAVVPCPAAVVNAVSNALDADFHAVPLRKDVIQTALHKKES